MVPELEILSDVEKILPPLTEYEYNGLRESIKAEGIRSPLIVWKNTILDGRHRYKIAKELNIPFKVVKMSFDSLEEAKVWIIQNQNNLRKLNAYTRVVNALQKKEEIAEKYRMRRYAGKKRNLQQDAVEGPDFTIEEIARIANVSPDAVLYVLHQKNITTKRQKDIPLIDKR